MVFQILEQPTIGYIVPFSHNHKGIPETFHVIPSSIIYVEHSPPSKIEEEALFTSIAPQNLI